MKNCCNINQSIQDLYSSIFLYALSKVRNEDIAKDIVQEVMCRFSEAYKDKIIIKHTRGWLYQTTKYIIADYFRKMSISFDDLVWHDEASSSNELESIWQDECIRQLIKMLPDKYAQPLFLYDIDNAPQKEIADKIGISLSATKMRIQRGRKMLHNLFLKNCNVTCNKDGNYVNCCVKSSCAPLVKAEIRFYKLYSD